MRLRTSLAGLFAVMLSATLMGACSSSSAPDPKERVSNDLKSADIKTVDVDYDRDARVLHLKGSVDTPAEKARAEDIAHRAVGTAGTIANELTIKGANDRTADDWDTAISRELNAKVNNDRALENRTVNFEVNNGVVTIKGEVKTEAEKDKVGDFAKSTENVKNVVNALEINPRMGQTGATPSRPVPIERNEHPDPKTNPSRR